MGYITPSITPFISRWNKPLILTVDPKFQPNIQVSQQFLEQSTSNKVGPEPIVTSKVK